MKKLLVLLGVMVFASCSSYAHIDESETSDIDTLRTQGYSESMLEVIDTVKSHNKGKNSKTQRYFRRKDHRSLGKGYDYLKLYIDPIQDDGFFGEHQINFSNNWNGDNTKYSSQYVRNNQADNL